MVKHRGTKKNVTLFVDEKIYNEAKGMGIAVSSVLEEILEDLIESPSMSKEEMEMRRKFRQQKQLMFQRDLLLDEIKDIELHLEELGMKIQEHEKLAERARASEERGKIVQALNQVLTSCDYDENIAWNNGTVQDMIKKLGDIDKEVWDMEKFVSHVERLKRLKRRVRR